MNSLPESWKRSGSTQELQWKLTRSADRRSLAMRLHARDDASDIPSLPFKRRPSSPPPLLGSDRNHCKCRNSSRATVELHFDLCDGNLLASLRHNGIGNPSTISPFGTRLRSFTIPATRRLNDSLRAPMLAQITDCVWLPCYRFRSSAQKSALMDSTSLHTVETRCTL